MPSKQVYKTDCRNCPHTIERAFDVTTDYVNKNPERRIRCSQCRTTNYIERPERVA